MKTLRWISIFCLWILALILDRGFLPGLFQNYPFVVSFLFLSLGVFFLPRRDCLIWAGFGAFLWSIFSVDPFYLSFLSFVATTFLLIGIRRLLAESAPFIPLILMVIFSPLLFSTMNSLFLFLHEWASSQPFTTGLMSRVLKDVLWQSFGNVTGLLAGIGIREVFFRLFRSTSYA